MDATKGAWSDASAFTLYPAAGAAPRLVAHGVDGQPR